MAFRSPVKISGILAGIALMLLGLLWHAAELWELTTSLISLHGGLTAGLIIATAGAALLCANAFLE